MRTTVMTTFNCERLEPYDPDYHELLYPDMALNLFFDDVDETSFDVYFEFDVTFRDQEEKAIGTVEIEATSHIENLEELPVDENGELLVDELPENVLRLIEGALAEDVLVPATNAVRTMKLPSLLPIPMVFHREEETKVRAEPS